MDLDKRAQRAADELNRSVTDLDLGTAHAAVMEQGAQRRHRTRQGRAAFIGAAAVFLLGAVAVVALAAGDGGRTDDRNERLATDLPGEGSSRDAAYAAKVFNSMPAGAMDGKASWRLPVLAKPQHDLAEGDFITLYGRGYEPNEQLGIVMCTSEADIENAGVNACQLEGNDGSSFGGVTYAYADADGNVVAKVAVRRYVTTPDGGEIDCASGPERCLVGMGAVSNYDRSGGAYIDFAAAPDFPQPTMTIAPEGPVVPGAPLTVSLGNLPPNRSIRLSQCVDDLCVTLVDTKAGATGAVDQVVSLQPAFQDPVSGRTVACENRCVLQARAIGPTTVLGAMASHAPVPEDIAVTFTSDVPTATIAATTTTTVAASTVDSTAPDVVTSDSVPPVVPAEPTDPSVPALPPHASETVVDQPTDTVAPTAATTATG